VEEESLTLTKGDIKDIYYLSYKGNLIAVVILGDGVSFRLVKDLVKYIEIK
jgi:hypothetical protein